jgi:hypothetical protein
MKSIPLPVKLAIAWLWVAVPLGWGVCQSAIKSAPLFSIQSEDVASGKTNNIMLDVEIAIHPQKMTRK